MEVTDITKSPPISANVPVVDIPVWKVRLKLFWRAVRTNVALFAENPIGLIGLAIILLFASLIVIHPILMRTVWDRNVYDPVVGIDLTIPFHPAPPSPDHLL